MKKAKKIKSVRMWTSKYSIGKDPCICVPATWRNRLVRVWGEENIIPVLIVPITPKRRKTK